MKRNIKILSIVLILVIVFIFGILIFNYFNDYNNVLYSNWNIKIPHSSKYKLIYEKQDEISFHGDGLRYHLYNYKYNKGISDIGLWKPINKNENNINKLDEYINKLNIDEKFMPNYDNCLFINIAKEDNSEIIILWDKKMKIIYLVESFI